MLWQCLHVGNSDISGFQTYLKRRSSRPCQFKIYIFKLPDINQILYILSHQVRDFFFHEIILLKLFYLLIVLFRRRNFFPDAPQLEFKHKGRQSMKPYPSWTDMTLYCAVQTLPPETPPKNKHLTYFFCYHKITNWFGLEGTLKIVYFQPMSRNIFDQTRLPHPTWL